MKVIERGGKEIINDRCSPDLEKKVFAPSKKLEKAKAYFREHGIPDFDKLINEANIKKQV